MLTDRKSRKVGEAGMKEMIFRTSDDGLVMNNTSEIELVRCTDCKHWERRECGQYGTCENRDGFYPFDWFCADGERKET